MIVKRKHCNKQVIGQFFTEKRVEYEKLIRKIYKIDHFTKFSLSFLFSFIASAKTPLAAVIKITDKNDLSPII